MSAERRIIHPVYYFGGNDPLDIYAAGAQYDTDEIDTMTRHEAEHKAQHEHNEREGLRLLPSPDTIHGKTPLDDVLLAAVWASIERGEIPDRMLLDQITVEDGDREWRNLFYPEAER